MKRLLGLFVFFSVYLYANEAVIIEWNKESAASYISSPVWLFNYKRFDLSINDQNRNHSKLSIEKSVCSNSDLRKAIRSGTTFIYNFIYKDGVMTIKIDRCN